MVKEGASDADILAATGHYETDDEGITALRERFRQLEEKFTLETAPLTKEVIDSGGLFIIGTERHESRRIDNQLRGRSGRQGDPGASRFYLSLDDDLMRIFGGERLTAIMDTLSVEESMPIQNRMLTGVIESSQKKVEARNFSIRKSVLDYDDVMNRMRETIYSQRDIVLGGGDIKNRILEMIDESIESNADLFLADEEDNVNWNIAGLRAHYIGWLTSSQDLVYSDEEYAALTKADVAAALIEKARKKYAEREMRFGADVMRQIERLVLLRVVDEKWMNHIDDMDQLRQGMHLRSYGQKNPVVEYRFEGYNMFDAMVDAVREDTSKLILTVEMVSEKEQRERAAARLRQAEAAMAASADAAAKKKPVRTAAQKIGRNDPCPCGSGKKYKNCCGRTPEVA